MYKDEYHPRVKKDLKKLDARVREEIKIIHIPAVLSNPDSGEMLTGDLQEIRSYHFKTLNQQYRIAYIVSEDEKTVYFLKAGIRENFYTALKRRI